MDAWVMLILALPMVCYVLALAWFALVALRLRLPVVAFTALLGASLGTFSQDVWTRVGTRQIPIEKAFNPVPSMVGHALAEAAGRWFTRSVPNPVWSANTWQSTTVQVDYTPWMLQYPQVSIILSGLLWGLVGLGIGVVAGRRWSRA